VIVIQNIKETGAHRRGLDDDARYQDQETKPHKSKMAEEEEIAAVFGLMFMCVSSSSSQRAFPWMIQEPWEERP